jgi:hypothetical protein
LVPRIVWVLCVRAGPWRQVRETSTQASLGVRRAAAGVAWHGSNGVARVMATAGEAEPRRRARRRARKWLKRTKKGTAIGHSIANFPCPLLACTIRAGSADPRALGVGEKQGEGQGKAIIVERGSEPGGRPSGRRANERCTRFGGLIKRVPGGHARTPRPRRLLCLRGALFRPRPRVDGDAPCVFLRPPHHIHSWQAVTPSSLPLAFRPLLLRTPWAGPLPKGDDFGPVRLVTLARDIHDEISVLIP